MLAHISIQAWMSLSLLKATAWDDSGVNIEKQKA